MAPSDGVTNTLGAIGGGVLAACLAPQLWKLWATRSARDLSYLFLVLYNLGLVLSFVYLYYEDALVAWVCILVELAFGFLMVAAKYYLDNWGPRSWRAAKRARPEARLTNSPSLASEIKIDVHDFAAGKAAPFPLLTPAPSHAAQHLLVDARLTLPAGAGGGDATGSASSDASSESGKAGSEDGKQVAVSRAAAAAEAVPVGASKKGGNGSSSAAVLQLVSETLEAALSAAGLPVQQRQFGAFPSFRRRPAQAEARQQEQQQQDEEAGAVTAAPDMLFFACKDGYATAIFYADTATLSLDLLAASDAAVLRMGAAAQQLCEELVAEWPGTRIAASAVSRLPRL